MRNRKRRAAQAVIDKGLPPAKVKKRIIAVGALLGKITSMIYGRSGTGKTTLAATLDELPAVVDGDEILLLDVNDEGTNSVYDREKVKVFEVREWSDFIGVYYYLKDYEHPYKGVIIDTGTQLQEVAMFESKIRAGMEPDSPMTKRSWGFLSSMLNPTFLQYRNLPMHVSILCQDRREKEGEDDMGDDMVPETGPALMPSVAKTVNAMVNVIGQTYIVQRNVKSEGKMRERIEYRLRIGPNPVFLTKVRSPRAFKVPGSIRDPSFLKIAEIIRGEYGNKKE